MDIASLSDQELLNFIIFLGTGAVMLAGIFAVAMVYYARSRRGDVKRLSTVDSKRAAHISAGEARDTMGSLLKSKARQSQESLSEERTSVDAQMPVQSLAVEDTEYRELLRVLVDSKGEKIVLEINEKRYEAISQIKDRAIGQRILETAAALLKFTGGYIATVGGVKALPIPEVKLSALPSKPKSAPQEPAKEQTSDSSSSVAEFMADLEEARRGFPQQELPKEGGSLWGRAFGRKEASEPEAEAPLLSLADEIDKLVQQKLQQANERTYVKIHSGVGGMVRFQVADKMYESIDQIEDTGVQAIIKSAIEAWNR